MRFRGYPIDWPDLVAVTRATGESIADLVAAVPHFSAPGLGTWDVEALTRHTMRAVTTLGGYLTAASEERPDGALLEDAPAYWCAYMERRDTDPVATDAAVERRGRAEAADVPATGLAEHLRDRLSTVMADVSAADPDTPLHTAMGPMRLGDYLRTRLAELVIHGHDLAAATGLPLDLPEVALADTADLLTTTAIRRGVGPDLIRVMTGRVVEPSPLPVIR